MIFTVSMKDPDTLHDAIREAVDSEVAHLGLDDDVEAEALAEVRREKTTEICAKWFEYGEYLRVEIDTKAGTCTVLTNK